MLVLNRAGKGAPRSKILNPAGDIAQSIDMWHVSHARVICVRRANIQDIWLSGRVFTHALSARHHLTPTWI